MSCPELDEAVDCALGAGALGARMIGGGFGGSAIALVHADSVDEVGKAATAGFARRGFTAPRLFTAQRTAALPESLRRALAAAVPAATHTLALRRHAAVALPGLL